MLNLLGNVLTPVGQVATGSGNGNQGANGPAPTEDIVEIVEPVTEAAQEPMVTTENPDYAPTASTPNSYWNSSEDEDLMSGVSAQLDTRESDEVVEAKAKAAHRAGLVPIICVGESLEERDRGEAVFVVERQLKGSVPETAAQAEIVVAYEPVWAIGTGRTPTVEQVEEIHDHMRRTLESRFGPNQAATRLLYGGSVKPSNAKDLMAVPNVNGALVGGASLRADDFWGIISAYL